MNAFEARKIDKTVGSYDTAYAIHRENPTLDIGTVQVGIVEQFNVGLYSALVSTALGNHRYVCLIGTQNVTPSFGFSDINLLREGDEVIFSTPRGGSGLGMILARKPVWYSIDKEAQDEGLESRTGQERRTHFFSDDCYRPNASPYSIPPSTKTDLSTRAFHNNRPTDMVPGEMGILNQHRCGILGGMFSASLVGGGAQIRLFSLENKIRIIADSIVQSTMVGNRNEWHNRRYLSSERSVCLYQEERLGIPSEGTPPFEKADYDKDGYFTKNKKPRQTAMPRIVEHEGYYGSLYSKYYLRPDPDQDDARTMDDLPIDPGVARESVDPSGQYRLAAAGMISMERTGRIPVPVRINYPWQKEITDNDPEALEEFKHDESHPYYRQLEQADRVAYDLKNSYARIDESPDEFFAPEEEDLEDKLEDPYDPKFTVSKTVKLQKYDKRRSGLWQGEDGSIIIRDAWGSEIVMIGGNIQISCAGNVETLPGKSALTLAGDDIISKAQNSIDIESADKDVRLNAYNNVQILAGTIEGQHPGGITLETVGPSFPWDADVPDPAGGESIRTRGIHLKSKEGTIVTDTKNMVLRARDLVSLVSGEEDVGGDIFISGKAVYKRADQILDATEDAAMMLSGSAVLVGTSAIVAGRESAGMFSADKFHVPLMLVPIDKNIAEEVMTGLQPFIESFKDEEIVALGYTIERLDKMIFKFRSSSECSTTSSWELSGGENFTLYEPFWVQVSAGEVKFETLEGVKTKQFEDHKDEWGGTRGHPWPGTEAIDSAKYAELSNISPVNLTKEGFNAPRDQVVDSTEVTEQPLFDAYRIRD